MSRSKMVPIRRLYPYSHLEHGEAYASVRSRIVAPPQIEEKTKREEAPSSTPPLPPFLDPPFTAPPKPLTPREITELREEEVLHPFAAKNRRATYPPEIFAKFSDPSKARYYKDFEDEMLQRTAIRGDGRLHDKPIDPNRTRFSQDIATISFSNYFSLLAGKSQVFPIVFVSDTEPNNPFRAFDPILTTRLQHTIGVKTLALQAGTALRLNLELIEAIALGHDIGHVAFGHAGERAIREIQTQKMSPRNLFHHKYNGERIARELNLTYEVRDGIAFHCGKTFDRVLAPREKYDISEAIEKDDDSMPITLEGCLVRLIDYLEYGPQDLVDLIHSKCFIDEHNELPDILEVLGDPHNLVNHLKYGPKISRGPTSPRPFTGGENELTTLEILLDTRRKMYETLINDLIQETGRAFSEGKKQIAMSQKVYDALQRLIRLNHSNIRGTFGSYEDSVVIPQLIFLYQEEKNDNPLLYSPFRFILKLSSVTDDQLRKEIEKLKIFDEVAKMLAQAGGRAEARDWDESTAIKK